MTTFFIYKSIKLIMKTNIKIILFSICTILLIFTSCTKEPGCMDPNSMTYNSEAQKDDGSCIYAYDIAQGIWNITPNCEEIDILGQTISLNDQLPESIEVQGEENNVLFIDIDGTVVSGEIDYSTPETEINSSYLGPKFSGDASKWSSRVFIRVDFITVSFYNCHCFFNAPRIREVKRV